MKPNQTLRYVDRGSCHTKNKCFEAISSDVFGRLPNLTIKYDKTMNDSRLDDYPNHAKVLKHAEIAPPVSFLK